MEVAAENAKKEEEEENKVAGKVLKLARKLKEQLKKSQYKAAKVVEEAGFDINRPVQ